MSGKQCAIMSHPSDIPLKRRIREIHRRSRWQAVARPGIKDARDLALPGPSVEL